MSESIRQSNLFTAEDYKKIFKSYQFIDYTAYDFDTLKQAMINYIQTYYPEDFNDYIESSEFIAIIELIAYLGTSLAFRTDLNSRENFIDTAERRESIIRLAQMVNYVPRRNIPASGLFKIASVQTNQPLTDANGININDVAIFWNDPNNPDWFDQFVQICNAAFSTLNPFGRPSKSGIIGSIPTDLYQLNSILKLAVTYPITVNVNGQQYPVDICNPDFVTNETIFERDPDPLNAFNFIYRNDSLGVGSANTGFFLYFRQGNLINIDSNFEFPVPNRIFPIDVQNINQDDVYVQETNKNGEVISKWLKVPALAGENIIYNSIQYSERNIFDVITGANDTISIRFADGNFGNVPTGLFRTWVRTSANQALVLRPDSVQGLQIAIPYIGFDQQQYTLQISFNLEQTIGNAAPSETDEQIRLRAPEVFSTQSRMVNGSDYNVLPLVYGNQIAKIQALDRTYSGQSRYIDLNDPTGFHRDLIIFGQDGALFRDNQNVLTEVIRDSSNSANINNILLNTIQEMLRDEKVIKFFYDEYITQFEQIIRVNKQVPTDPGWSLLDIANPYQDPLFWKTSPAKFKNTTGYFVNSKSSVVVSVPILSITHVAEIATLTTTVPHGLTSGRTVVITGTSPSNYSGTFVVTVTSATTFTYTMTSAPVSDATILGSYLVSPYDALPLVNILTPSNPSTANTNTYQPWGLITSGSVLKFANSTKVGPIWVPDLSTENSTAVNSVLQNGLPLVINPANAFSLIGPVELSVDEQNYYQATKVYPAFRNDLTSTEIIEINNAINAGISFWLYFDLLQNEWHVSTAATPGLSDQSDQPFVYAPPIINAGVPEIYSDWAPYAAGGLLYVSIATNSQDNTIIYDLTARGRSYVFESYRDVRFYWEPNNVVLDSESGLALRDTIEIMPLVNTNETIDNNLPVITDPTLAYLRNPVNFDITGVFIQSDGYQDTSKVEVSLVDVNEDNIPDDIEGFSRIVTPRDRVVFEYYNNEVSGYQTTRPWISRWGVELQDYVGGLYVYFPVDPNDATLLYSAPFISNVEVDDQYNPTDTVGSIIMFLDQYDLMFINNASQIALDGLSPVLSICNQVTAFFNGPTATDLLAYPWLAGTELVSDKIDIVTNYFINKSYLLSSISPPGFGVYNLLKFTATSNLGSYPAGQIIESDIDKYHFDKNGKVFTQNTTVPENSRLPMYFKWNHYSPIDQRIDPSATNIIDMIVITDSYYRDMVIWKNSNGTITNMPDAPTTEELRIQFQDLNKYKMVSDSMVWNSGTFKILFGPQAEAELQATFKVVKAPTTSISDNEVKTKVIQAIDAYFDIRNWDFGEKFFYTELAAFIHQQLSRLISSVVIVPNNATSQFGNLFEIIANPNQLFMSTATVNNVQIVSNLTDQNLRV